MIHYWRSIFFWSVVACVAIAGAAIASARADDRPESQATAKAMLAKGNVTEALRIWQSQAREGNCQAMIGLSGMYEIGWGTAADTLAATKWALAKNDCSTTEFTAVAELIRPIAESGDPNAQAFLGLLLENSGSEKAAGAAEAMRWLKLAADQGAAYAQFAIGSFYEDGEGVHKDLNKAQEWYRLAAAQGNGMALHNLAGLYRNGKGVKKDPQEALRWYRLGAEHGDARSTYMLGWMTENSKGVQKDNAEALKWYVLAARQGDPAAQVHLGDIYRDGKGVKTDIAEAYKWYGLATFNARLLQRRENYNYVVDEFQKAGNRLAGTQRSEVLMTLARNCRDGEGLPMDQVAAFVFLDLAVQAEPDVKDRGTYLKEQEALGKQLTSYELSRAKLRLSKWPSL